MRTLVASYVVFLAFFISACAKYEGTSQTPSPKTTKAPKPMEIPKLMPFTKGISYATNCEKSEVTLAGVKIPTSKKQYSEEGDRFVRLELLFTTDDGCSSEALTIKETGQVLVSDEKLKPHESNLNFEQTFLTLKNDLIVSAFNLDEICGFSDWELNIEKDISSVVSSPTCLARSLPRTENQKISLEVDQK